jgi:hypothetical protein
MLQPIFSFEYVVIPYISLDDFYRELIARKMLGQNKIIEIGNILRESGMPESDVLVVIRCHFDLKIQLDTFEIHYGIKKRIIMQDGETYNDISLENVNGDDFIDDLTLLFNRVMDLHEVISWRFRNKNCNLSNVIFNLNRNQYIHQSDIEYIIDKYESKIAFFYHTKRDISLIKLDGKIIWLQSPCYKYIDEIPNIIKEIQSDIKLDNDFIEMLNLK